MIRGFHHKGLEDLFEKGASARVRKPLQDRYLRRLGALDHAVTAQDMNVPGFDFHALHGKPRRYTVHVTGHGASHSRLRMETLFASTWSNTTEAKSRG